MDLCETWLATTFDPEMAFSHADNVGHEPHFAVRKVGTRSMMIAYAISYYVDLGTQDPLCETYFTTGLCRGHYGDSEGLYFTVTYDPETQHWVLTSAVLSQHDGSQTLTSAPGSYVQALTYPSHAGAYPRIYPSYGKHANYPDPNSCQSGFPHLDACIPPYTYQRLGTTGSAQNLGSNAHRLLDCVASTNPFYSMNPPECYWSGARFDGWQDALPDTDPYGPKLTSYGF